MTENATSHWGWSQGPGRSLNILVVDDDPMNQALLGDVCAAFGWETVAVNRGDQVLPALYDHEPDLLLLDLMLPGMDGFAVLEQVRADPRLAVLPVVVVSAISDRDAVWRADTLGVRHYLVKPISLDELRRAIDDVLSARDRLVIPDFRKALVSAMERLLLGPEARLPSALVVLGVLPVTDRAVNFLSKALLDDFPRPHRIYRMGEGRVAVLIPGGDFHEARALLDRLSKRISKSLTDKVILAGGVVVLDRVGATEVMLAENIDEAVAALSVAFSRGGGLAQGGH